MDVWCVAEGEKDQCRAETEDRSGGHSGCGGESQTAMVRTCSEEGRERLGEESNFD